MIALLGAVFMMLVELMVFVIRSMKADKVLEKARKVRRSALASLPKAAGMACSQSQFGTFFSGGGVPLNQVSYQKVASYFAVTYEVKCMPFKKEFSWLRSLSIRFVPDLVTG